MQLNKFLENKIVKLSTFPILLILTLFVAIKEVSTQPSDIPILLIGNSVIFLVISVARLWYEFRDSILIKSKTSKTIKKRLPSKFSLFIAAALQKPENREFALGCIEERFKKDVKKRSYRWAKLMLWRDNLVALWAAFGDKTVRFLKWIGFGYLIEKLLVMFR